MSNLCLSFIKFITIFNVFVIFPFVAKATEVTKVQFGNTSINIPSPNGYCLLGNTTNEKRIFEYHQELQFNIGNKILQYWVDCEQQKQNQGQIKLIFNNEIIKEIDSLLSNLNFMLSLDLPPKTYKLRIISDNKEIFEIGSYSTWISKKPHVKQVTSLKKREEVELVFKGETASIYSQIPIFINVSKK